MLLLVFAHYAEAQQTIENLNLKQRSQVPQLFCNDQVHLVVSGEKGLNLLVEMGALFFNEKYQLIINLGIAGSIDLKLPLGQIYSIRSSFAYSTKPEFHSYSSVDNDSSVDCITSFEREVGENLSGLKTMGALVDRELWFIAKLAKFHQIPWRSYKIISDHLIDLDCKLIREQAPIYSQKLWLKVEKLLSESPSNQGAQEDYSFLENFKVSSRRKVMLKSLLDQFSKERSLDFNQLSEELKLDHVKSLAELEQDIQARRFPFREVTRERFNHLVEKVQSSGASITFDPHYEKKKFRLSSEINSQKNIDDLVTSLAELDFSKFEEIWQGDV